MTYFFIEYKQSDGFHDSLYFDTSSGTGYIHHNGEAITHPSAAGKDLGSRQTLSVSEANALRTDGGAFNNSHTPIYVRYATLVIQQQLQVFFYPDGNVADPVVNQQLQVFFYPDSNVTEPEQDQELKVYFYPDGNVTEQSITNQELEVFFYPEGNVIDDAGEDQQLKVFFYPEGNIEDIDPNSINYKWWFGMRGKTKYGNRKIKRIRL